MRSGGTTQLVGSYECVWQLMKEMGYTNILNGGTFPDIEEIANMNGVFDSMVDSFNKVAEYAAMEGCMWLDVRPPAALEVTIVKTITVITHLPIHAL